MREFVIQQEVIRIAKKLYARQMLNANEGNVSILSEGRVYITPSQICKELLVPEMIAVTDLSGRQLAGDEKPSSELLLHLYIYQNRADLCGVVHCHSPYATAFAIARKPIASKGYAELISLYDKIPVADYGMPSTSAITEGMGRYLHQTDVILLANHGVVAAGKDVQEAYLKAEAVESIAKTLLLARLLGGEVPIEEEELARLYAERTAQGRSPIE